MMGRRIAAFLAVLIFTLLLRGTAGAHANLVRSEPEAGAVLQSSPSELVLEFSENLDPSFTKVQLLSSANQIVNPGPGTIDPAQPRVLHLTLSMLPKDSYTAVWRARSSEDGHISEGSVPFGVGVATNTTSLLPPVGAPDPATELPSPLDTVTRWLNLLVAAAAFGVLPFVLLVWRPAVRATSGATAADAAMTSVFRRLIIIGCVVFLLTNVLFLLTQAADAADVSLLGAIGAPIVQLLGGRSGVLWLIRIALTVLIALLGWQLPPAGSGSTWRWWTALVLSSGVLLTFSLQAHGAALDQGAALAVTSDWLHIAMTVIWLGGLVPLALAIRSARRVPATSLPLATFVPRFSRLALVCVVVLTLTGVYSYFLHIGQLDLLPATTYGRALLVKLGLFVLLLLPAATNLLTLVPRLRIVGNRLVRAFRRTVNLELVFGALLLLVVGVMTSVAPSAAAWEAHEQLGTAQSATVGDVNLVLRVAPLQIGDNAFAVDVQDNRPGAQAAAAKVLLRFTMSSMDNMGTLQTETQTTDNQRYTVRGSYTTMGGRWLVEVVLRRAGFDDVRHTFQLDVVHAPGPASAE